MKKRSRTDIAAQILMAASESVTRTAAMYSAVVDYAQLKHYLMILIENGLLEYDRSSQTYKTTKKGLMFIRMYSKPAENWLKIPQ
jgi:predicted transcriptional regulator